MDGPTPQKVHAHFLWVAREGILQTAPWQGQSVHHTQAGHAVWAEQGTCIRQDAPVGAQVSAALQERQVGFTNGDVIWRRVVVQLLVPALTTDTPGAQAFLLSLSSSRLMPLFSGTSSLCT